MAGNSKGGSVKPDFASIGGIVLAVGGILAGLTLEGGSVRDVAQVTAAMIVLGGTLGAVMLTTPPHVLLGAFKKLPMVFLSEDDFWAPLFHLIQHTVDANLTPKAFADSLLAANSVEGCIEAMQMRVAA